MKRKAFTLIEMAAVILIILILVGISLPLLNKGSTHHEAKLVAHSIQSLISLCGGMARSSAKVYFVDTDFNSSFTIADSVVSTNTRYRFGVLRIYSATWNATLIPPQVESKFCGESYDVPVSIASSFSFNKAMNSTPPPSDRIYFKPDGTITSDVLDIMICPENRIGLYYQLELDQNGGTTVLKSYQDG